MKKILSASVFALICLLAGNVNAATIVNGSFEDLTGLSGFDGVPVGWTFTGTQVQVLNSSVYGPSGADGFYYVEIYNSSDLGTLSQTVTGLTVGQEYKLSFLWGNRLNPFDITVEMGGSSFNQSGTGVISMTPASFFFTAASTSVPLNITWNTGTDVSGALDAFVLTGPESVVPLPASLPLFATGLGAMGLVGWRRNKKMAKAAG